LPFCLAGDFASTTKLLAFSSNESGCLGNEARAKREPGRESAKPRPGGDSAPRTGTRSRLELRRGPAARGTHVWGVVHWPASPAAPESTTTTTRGLLAWLGRLGRGLAGRWLPGLAVGSSGQGNGQETANWGGLLFPGTVGPREREGSGTRLRSRQAEMSATISLAPQCCAWLLKAEAGLF
jgi:hypothetical protein